MIGRQLELSNENSKTHNSNVKDIKIMHPVGELIKYMPGDTAFGHTARYCAHLTHLKDLHWSLNEHILPDI